MDVIEIPRPAAEPRSRSLADELSTLDHAQRASVLAGVDRRALSGQQLLQVIAAEARHLAWVQAGMAASLSEFAHCPPYAAHPSARLSDWQEFADDEAALVPKVSPVTASKLVGQSIAAYRRHPNLGAAWRDGLIDCRKAAVVTRTTSGATDAVKAAIDKALFDRSARPGRLSARDVTVGQTPGQLQRRARAALVAADPAAARVRTRTALRNRRLVTGADRDAPGVGYLSGCDLPLADVAAAYAHIDAIARSIKQLGDPRLLDQLRADVFIDLLLGNDPSPSPRPRDGQAAEPMEPEPADTEDADPSPEEAPKRRAAPSVRSGIDLVVPIGLLADLADAIRCGTVADIAGFGLVPRRRHRATGQTGRRAAEHLVLHRGRRHRPGGQPRPNAARSDQGHARLRRRT